MTKQNRVRKRSNKEVTIVKTGDDGFVDSKTKQDSERVIEWLMYPEVPFSLLISVVESSFVVGGIIDKLSTVGDSGFYSFNDDDIEWFPKEQVEHLRALLDDFDVKHALTNIATCWNYWLEITWGQDSKKPWDIDLIPFLTSQCRLRQDRTLTQITAKGENPFDRDQYIQLKTRSLKTRYYWDSIFSKCVRQIVVLDAIDKHYEKFFEDGMINTKLLADVNGELWEDSIKIIQETIKDRVRGQDNSFTTAIIPADLKVIDLTNEVDVKGLLAYRLDLIKSIAIALNVPYDMLISDSSNRATSEVSMEVFNMHIVKPLQEHFVKQLRKALRPYFGNLVNVIELKSIDTRNQKEEMEINVWYKTAGILTANEVRARIGEDPIDWGDVLETRSWPTADEINQVNKIKKSLSEAYGDNLLWNK